MKAVSIEPMLAGALMDAVPEDNRKYLVDLGLLRRDGAGGLVVAYPIYRGSTAASSPAGPRTLCPASAPPG